MATKKPMDKKSEKVVASKPKKARLSQTTELKSSAENSAANAVESELADVMEPITTPSEKAKQESAAGDRGVIILGFGLLVMGVLLLGGRLLQIPFGDYLWPFIFIIPGALLLFFAVSSDRGGGEGIAILGGILSMLGAIFLMQTVTGWWATWAYIWALVAPTSIGLSQMAYGNIRNKDSIVSTGWNLTKIGLSLFAAGFVFLK